MRMPKRDGSYPDTDDVIYNDVPATKRLKQDQLLELVNYVVDGDTDGLLIAGALAKEDRVAPKVHDAYEREAQRISGLLSTSLGPPIISKMEEVGFIGYRWTVRGVPIVLAPYQEDSDLPLELFLTRVTPATTIYLAPSLTRPAPKPRVEKKITPKPRPAKKPSKKASKNASKKASKRASKMPRALPMKSAPKRSR